MPKPPKAGATQRYDAEKPENDLPLKHGDEVRSNKPQEVQLDGRRCLKMYSDLIPCPHDHPLQFRHFGESFCCVLNEPRSDYRQLPVRKIVNCPVAPTKCIPDDFLTTEDDPVIDLADLNLPP